MTDPQPPGVAALIATSLTAHASRILLSGPEGALTGADLDADSAALAQGLAAQGIGPGDVVALIGDNTLRIHTAWLAVQRLAAVTCVLHARETPERLAAYLGHVGARLLLAGPSSLDKARAAAAAAGIPVLALDGAGAGFDRLLAAHRGQPAPPPPAVDDEAPAAILLSSGSTGLPKAVVHSQRSLRAIVRESWRLFGPLGPGTRFLQTVGTSFAAWTFTGPPVILSGGRLVIRPAFTPQGFCEAVAAEGVNIAATVPTMLRMLTPDVTARFDLGSLRTVLCSGEAPERADIDRVLGWSPQADFRCLYLASESGPPSSTLCRLEDLMSGHRLRSAGRPIPGAALRIVAPDGGIGDILPPGAVGEIALSGPSLASGYLGEPERSRTRFVDGWWRSGDLGRVDEDGFLFFEGRTDNVINTGGIKVYGEEIEAALLAHPAVAQAAVVGMPDPRWGAAITAHLVCTAPLTPDALDRHCATAGLAGFKIPKSYHFHAALPLGATGKIDRGALRALAPPDTAAET